jgi:Xaa-Pro aminopeptidase
MKYHRINKELFIHNRQQFVKHLKPKSLAVFNSNDIITTSADSTMPFVQHRDILHLSALIKKKVFW